MKIYRRLLASYLCVCLVPLLISMFTIFNLERNVRDSMEQDIKFAVRSTQQHMDQTLSNTANAINILAEDTLISALAEKTALAPLEIYDLCELIDLFSVTVNQREGYFRGFCYFYRSGFLVSNKRTYHPNVTELFSHELELDFAALAPRGGEDGVDPQPHIRTLYQKDGSGCVLVYRNIYDARYKESVCCIGIVIQLNDRLLQRTGEGLDPFVTGEDGQLLYGSGLARQALAQGDLPALDGGTLQVEGEGYLCATRVSNLSGMRYGALAAQREYYRDLRLMWGRIILECAVSVAVGVMAAVFLSRQTWSPFKSALMLINKPRSSGERTEYNSMKSVAQALTSVAQERESMESQLLRLQARTRSGQIGRYLAGLTDDPSLLSQYIEDGQPYWLIVFSIAATGEDRGQAGVLEQLYTAICRVLEEVLLEKKSGVSLALDGRAVMLVQGTLTGEEVRRAVAMAEQALSVPVVCYISDPCMYLADAPDAWSWVRRAYQSDIFWQRGRGPGVWPAKDILRGASYRDYRDLLERQRKLAGYMAGKNYGKARQCLEEIVAQDLSDQEMPFEMIQHRYAGVCEMLLAYLPDREGFEAGRHMPGPGSTAGQLEAWLFAVFERVQQQAGPGEEGAAGNQESPWARQVQAYIRENYRDPALNASMIAGHLQMNLSTLSRRYKNAVGRGLLDEVHTVRLEAAKTLLDKGVSVRETAERTGYVESRAMIRAFKRYEGITPGQYAGRE
ncbi:AraC family transcriptional regulator [Acutalibacter caecimuris]|uniref:AraC family transcriptional regulator n=1 Tax=Acutalibacter caecimuris TaxID=3093657 RepID=UPI002AC9C866|nr:AraC family transcriptional regulator [Acutalibacter sp. M00118]